MRIKVFNVVFFMRIKPYSQLTYSICAGRAVMAEIVVRHSDLNQMFPRL